MRGCQPLAGPWVWRVALVFEGRFRLRDVALWWTGVQTGLRVSELLSLDWRDVTAGRGIRPQVAVKRRATKRRLEGKVVSVPAMARQALEDWRVVAGGLHGAGMDWPVFFSRSGRRMTRYRAWEVIHGALDRAEAPVAVRGTHTMRKTFVREVREELLRRQAEGARIDVGEALQTVTGHRRYESLQAYLESMALEGAAAAVSAMDRMALERGDGGLTVT